MPAFRGVRRARLNHTWCQDFSAGYAAIGLPATRAVAAFAQGAYAEAAALLLAARPQAGLMTGSHAQRDVLELTLIEAALRVGELSLAAALLVPRLARKPRSARTRHDLGRCGRKMG